jgi:hypothetical protein
MQELLEERLHWVSQPVTPERQAALKDISKKMRQLGEGIVPPPKPI